MPKDTNTSNDCEPNFSGPSLRWLVAQFGAKRAFSIISEHSYSRVSVPQMGGETRSDFAQSLSNDELRHFQSKWAGHVIDLPVARQFQCQFMALRQDKKRAEIARFLRVKEQTVYRSLKNINHALINFEPLETAS